MNGYDLYAHLREIGLPHTALALRLVKDEQGVYALKPYDDIDDRVLADAIHRGTPRAGPSDR